MIYFLIKISKTVPIDIQRKKEEHKKFIENFDRDNILKQGKIMVIGANYDFNDYRRWSEIDKNYIGISHTTEEGIYLFEESWNKEKDYWETVFDAINENKNEIDIYFDRATIDKIENFKGLIEKIFENDKIKKIYFEINRFNILPDEDKIISKAEYITTIKHNVRNKEFIKNILPYFKCCGEIKEVMINAENDFYYPDYKGPERKSWISYKKREGIKVIDWIKNQKIDRIKIIDKKISNFKKSNN